MKDKILPTIVLTIICTAAALLLTFAHEVTKDSIAGQKELKFSKSVERLFGDCEIRMLDSSFGCDEIKNIAVTPDGKTAVEIVADGYSKGGIDVLIGFGENGSLTWQAIVAPYNTVELKPGFGI